VCYAGQVTDLGAVLHMVGGTAASYMIFFLPGLLLINAAIVKHSASSRDLSSQAEVRARLATPHASFCSN
jgi:sodium-coupled neutral amino acid transporter 7/8